MATSHKRDTNARKPRTVTVAAPLALAATLSAVSLGVLAGDPVTNAPSSDPTFAAAAVAAPAARSELLSRSGGRQDDAIAALDLEKATRNAMSKAAIIKAVKNATEFRWTTTELNLWNQPGKKAKKLGVLDTGKKVLVTGRAMWGRTELVVGGTSRWVTTGYLSDTEPPKLGGACTNGTSVASGVSSSIVAVHNAVCANFPEITVYGTLRGGGGDHPLGRAVDIMVSGARGWQVANFLRENYAALGISYIIYSQQIWSVERGGEGWRGMENRGSATANHYDHVHVSVF